MALAIIDGSQVRELLKARRLSQRAFARRIGLHEVTVSEALNGRPVTAETVRRIAQGLEDTLPVADLRVAS
jgi:transcriptional regulator with XRE-family HTH domain